MDAQFTLHAAWNQARVFAAPRPLIFAANADFPA
jgi:hypothetical protein